MSVTLAQSRGRGSRGAVNVNDLIVQGLIRPGRGLCREDGGGGGGSDVSKVVVVQTNMVLAIVLVRGGKERRVHVAIVVVDVGAVVGLVPVVVGGGVSVPCHGAVADVVVVHGGLFFLFSFFSV